MKISIFQRLPPLLFLILLLFSASAAAEQSGGDLFDRANKAYSKGDFSTAIKFYEQLTAESGYRAGVLFNLGNSYARSGQTGKAILNYERALRLSPADSDIKGNLQLIRKETGLFPREYSWSERFFRLLDLNQWMISALSFLLLLTALQLLSLKISLPRQALRSISTACLILSVLSGAAALSRHQQWQPSVVTGEDSRLLLSPFDSSASTSSIKQGRLVYPQKRHGGFKYITAETGSRGWIVSAAIEPVIKKQDSRNE